MKRIASVIGIKTENIDRYEELHRAINFGALNSIKRS